MADLTVRFDPSKPELINALSAAIRHRPDFVSGAVDPLHAVNEALAEIAPDVRITRLGPRDWRLEGSAPSFRLPPRDVGR